MRNDTGWRSELHSLALLSRHKSGVWSMTCWDQTRIERLDKRGATAITVARNTKNFTIVYGVSNKYASHAVRTMDLLEQQASCPG